LEIFNEIQTEKSECLGWNVFRDAVTGDMKRKARVVRKGSKNA
jgi:hypothetical protein